MLASKLAIGSTRSLASAAAAATSHSNALLPAIDTKVTKLPNGFTVASVEMNGAVSNILLAYRAGSRYQQPNENGLVHHLRNNIGKDSPNYLGVKLLWQLGNVGANLSSSISKDLIAVQSQVVRDNSAITVSITGEMGRPAFKKWDVEDSLTLLPTDLHAQQPYDIALELFHKAAYRNGSLGNSLLASPSEIGNISAEQLENYTKARFVTGEAVLVGINVDHEHLLTYGQYQKVIKEGKGTSAASSPYYSGNARIDATTSFAHVIIGGEGAAISNSKAVATQHVLAFLIGSKAGVKFVGASGSGVVGAAVQAAANKRHVGCSAVNISHSDSGLVGVYLTVEGQYAEPTVKAAWSALKGLASNIDEVAFKSAQSSAQLEALLRAESNQELALDYAAELLANGTATLPTDLAKEIANVTVEDVKKAVQKIVAKPSLAAYGRINQVPYVDQL